ncbi:hypothetical protein DPMN_188886 [Dreissena polymorpha]|uniref:Uncharacterized protein n=1 Tax=Dreissena polymorpha TaxID=45954 RepID=A0A9D4DUA2_DREPO|nr:hypothetical protein DPMN_188886 [Dreissena polymorpha]
MCDKDDDEGPGLEELDDEFNSLLLNLDDYEENEVSLPEGLDLNQVMEKLRSETPLSPLQYECNEIISKISEFRLEHFAKQEISKLSQLLNESKTSDTGQVVSQDLGIFFSKVHTHANSLDFRMQCLKLFKNETSDSIAHTRNCFNISVEIRKFVLAKKAKKVQLVTKSLSKSTITVLVLDM